MEFKNKWVNTLYAESRATTLLFHIADQITDATVQLEESLRDFQESAMLDPQVRDPYGIGLPTMHAMGPVNSSHLGLMFAPVEL